jgi:hypothetical protein
MKYNIIKNLPIDYNFANKSRDELKLYGKWFFDNKKDRLKCLNNAINSNFEYKNCLLNFTPQSLLTIGQWFKNETKKEFLSEKEFLKKRATIPNWIEVSNYDLTAETYSKVIDVGIYFGEVFLHNFSGLKWEQFFSKIKNDNNNGHMVIKGTGKIPLNPIWKMYIIALQFADYNETDNVLFELYNFLSTNIKNCSIYADLQSVPSN